MNYTKQYSVKVKKIELISPNIQIKEILVLMLTHNVIDDVIKIVKINKHFLILHGMTLEGGNSYEVVVKTYWNFPNFKDAVAKKERSNSISNRSVPNASNLYQYMTVKVIENLLVFKVSADHRNIPKLIESIKDDKCDDYNELLKIYSNVKQNHSKVIRKNDCFTKDLVWHDNKWKIISSNRVSLNRSFPDAVATLEHVMDICKTRKHKRHEHRQLIENFIQMSKQQVFHYYVPVDFIDNYLMRSNRPNACDCYKN